MLQLVHRICCQNDAELDQVNDLISMFVLDLYSLELALVVKKNRIHLLVYLLQNHGKGFQDYEVQHAICEAAKHPNRLAIVQLLVRHVGIQPELNVFLTAVEFNNLTLLHWFYDQKWFSYSKKMVEHAAWTNSLTVIEWLCENNFRNFLGGQAQRAANIAAMAGHGAIVQYFYAQKLIRCVFCVMSNAVECGHLDIAHQLERLESNRMPVNMTSATRRGGQVCSKQHLVDAKHVTRSIREAIANGGLSTLQWLLNRNQVLEQPLEKELLTCACLEGNLSLVRKLYKKRTGKHWQRFFTAPMEAACKGGHLPVIAFFLEQGLRLQSVESILVTGGLRVMRFYQQKLPSFAAQLSRWKPTPDTINRMAWEVDSEVIEFCWSTYPQARSGLTSLEFLLKVMENRDEESFKFLLAQCKSFKVICELLRRAIGRPFIELDFIKFLYAEAKTRQLTPSSDADRSFAAQSKQFWVQCVNSSRDCDVILFLLSNEALDGTSLPHAVEIAISKRNLALVKELHCRNIGGFTCHTLDKALASGSLPIVRFLHQHCAQDFDYARALHSAAWNGHFHIVQFLYDIRRPTSCEPIHDVTVEATTKGHIRIVKFLLSTHQCPSLESKVFSNACKYGQRCIVEWQVTTGRIQRVNRAFIERLAVALPPSLWEQRHNGNIRRRKIVDFLTSNCCVV